LGIRLAKSILPEAFTVDHVPKSLVYNAERGLTSAPKSIKVWAIFDVNKIPASLVENDHEWDGYETPGYLHLASFSFDINSRFAIQSHAARSWAKQRLSELGLSVAMVLVEVESNWGNPDWTCLYRFRVHGQAAE
jgi:SUN domain-containing protein 1/2